MIGRLAFLFARTTGNEPALRRLSLREEVLLQAVAGASVALVGNARALAEQSNGGAIDAADVVVRLNSAPMPSAGSHGTRTDWLAVSTPVRASVLAERAPRNVLWMTRKRRRLPYALATRPGFYLNSLPDVARLRDRLGSPPSTGAMVIELLARSDMARLTLYGFDFFASQSLSGHRSAAQVPHDFAAERAFVEDLIARDPRIALAP